MTMQKGIHLPLHKIHTMKQASTLVLLLLLSYCAFSQSSDFTLTFEDTTVIQQVYYTDSILDPAGIWQIGKPNKSFMNSALTPPNAVVTELDSLLSPGSMGSFIITIPNVQLWENGGMALTFAHKFEFDTAHGGGYVQFSVDSGRQWHNIFTQGITDFYPVYPYCIFEPQVMVDSQMISPPTWWHNLPTNISAQIPLFTGTDSIWNYDTIVFPAHALPDKTFLPTPYMFKFTAYADTLSTLKGGWLIDNINVISFGFNCPGGINEISSSHLNISPNPTTNGFHIALTGEIGSDYTVALYDLTGREMMQKSFSGNVTTLRRDGLAAGSYIVKVTNSRTQDTFEKRVVME